MKIFDYYSLFYKGAWEIHITNINTKNKFKLLSELARQYSWFLYDGYKIRIYYKTPKEKNFIIKCIFLIKERWWIDEIFHEFENQGVIIFNYLNFFGSNKKTTNCLEISRGIDENF